MIWLVNTYFPPKDVTEDVVFEIQTTKKLKLIIYEDNIEAICYIIGEWRGSEHHRLSKKKRLVNKVKSYFKEKFGGGVDDEVHIGNSGIYKSSLQCLGSNIELNDTTVQFAIELAYQELSDDIKDQILIFPCDFYTQLRKKRFESIQKQMSKSNFMNKNLVIYIVCTGTHFMLSLIIDPGSCNDRDSNGPILMILDSGQRFQQYFAVVRDFQKFLPRYDIINLITNKEEPLQSQAQVEGVLFGVKWSKRF